VFKFENLNKKSRYLYTDNYLLFYLKPGWYIAIAGSIRAADIYFLGAGGINDTFYFR
jgi:hypothetical protein